MESSFSIASTILFSTSDDKKSSCSNKMINERENRQLKKIYAKSQTIEECLSTLDIFKSLMEDADEMKSKIIRDVAKSIYISSFDEGDVIYDVQYESNEIFLVFYGQVSLKIRKRVQVQNSMQITEQQHSVQEFVYQQVETFQKGEGFGQSEFIRGRKRDFQACVKTKGSIIGRLHIESFEEVIENYKMRVYYKKLQMFKKCPLLSEISGNRLQFLVNSSKPLLLTMSKTLVREGQHPKCLYLVSKGQLQFVKNGNIGSESPTDQWKAKKVSKYFVNPSDAKEKLQIRKVNEGSFIGDVQIALNQSFGYDVVTASSKVYLYACDIRLILSQIPQQNLEQSSIFYQQKLMIQLNQLTDIKQTRKTNTYKSKFSFSALTPEQIKIKKQIRKRYLNLVPFSLVDESSPQQICKMIERKRSRIKTEPTESTKNVPQLELFQKKSVSPKRKTRNMLLKDHQKQRNFSIDHNNYYTFSRKEERIKSEREFRSINSVYGQQPSKKSPPISPKRRKVSLPPIISIAMLKRKTESAQKKNKNKEVRLKLKQSSEYTLGHRMSEFLLKIQVIKQAKQQN